MRHEDWDVRLSAFVDGALPHAWGTNDCAMFAAGAVLAMTGVDPAAEWRGSYATEDDAAALMDRLGGLDAVCLLKFGEPVPPLCARRGDLLLGFEREVGEHYLAVCVGAVGVSPGTVWDADRERGVFALDGLVHRPLSEFKHAYRVD